MAVVQGLKTIEGCINRVVVWGSGLINDAVVLTRGSY